MYQLPSINAVIAQPELLQPISIAVLEELSIRYPYFAEAHIFLAKKYQLEVHPAAETQLHKAALYSHDRKQLFELMQVADVKPIITPLETSKESVTSTQQDSAKVAAIVDQVITLETAPSSNNTNASESSKEKETEAQPVASATSKELETPAVISTEFIHSETSNRVVVETPIEKGLDEISNTETITLEVDESATVKTENNTVFTLLKPVVMQEPPVESIAQIVKKIEDDLINEISQLQAPEETDELDALIRSANLATAYSREYSEDRDENSTEQKRPEILYLPSVELKKPQNQSLEPNLNTTASDKQLSFLDWLKKHNQGSVIGKTPPSLNAQQNHPNAVKKVIQNFAGSMSEQEEEVDNLQVDLQEIASFGMQTHDEFITETMARIYVQQEKFDKAIAVYEKLSLLKPEKSTFFASLIEKIKNESK
jgi:hypothetical protein